VSSNGIPSVPQVVGLCTLEQFTFSCLNLYYSLLVV